MSMIDTADTRFPKAVAIADQAGQWLKCRTPNGDKRYGIPSQRKSGVYYLVTQTSCTCEDAARHSSRICKHALAVQIHCARVAGKPMPASDTIDGLQQMVAQQQPVLDMVRHENGEVSWTRHEHADGHVTHLPSYAVNAAKYDSIFKRFGED